MKIYIAASWKHQHAVEMLTFLLRVRGHTVLSFVENNHGEGTGKTLDGKPVPFEEWVKSAEGRRSFEYDTKGASLSDLVIYIGPSGKDAACEVGIAWANGVPIIGLLAKGEDFGLMRLCLLWCQNYTEVLVHVESMERSMEKS